MQPHSVNGIVMHGWVHGGINGPLKQDRVGVEARGCGWLQRSKYQANFNPSSAVGSRARREGSDSRSRADLEAAEALFLPLPAVAEPEAASRSSAWSVTPHRHRTQRRVDCRFFFLSWSPQQYVKRSESYETASTSMARPSKSWSGPVNNRHVTTNGDHEAALLCWTIVRCGIL